MGCYSVVKKKQIMKFAGKWMVQEPIIPREVNQTLKDQYCMFLLQVGVSFYALNMCFIYTTHRCQAASEGTGGRRDPPVKGTQNTVL